MSDIHERFTIKEGELIPSLQVFLDEKEISITDLVAIANQLANGLLNAGMVFKLENKEE